nr:MetS family NSS transporter small subunit [uncultured Aminipila sp.]
MSVGAINMMIIGCTGLWGGCAVAVTIAIKNSKKNS